MISCDNGDETCVQMLLDARANTDIRSKSGETALYLARNSSHTHVVELLTSATP